MKRSYVVLDYGMILLSTTLGMGSVILFAASIGGMITGVHLQWSESTLLLWDGVLSLAFFTQHSLMVRRQFRKRLDSLLPERYQGAFYSMASGIVLTPVALCWQHSGRSLYHLEGLVSWLVYGVAAIALAILVWAATALRSFDLLGLDPIRAHLHGRAYRPSPFTARGPYRWVRHPTYLSILILFWFTPALSTDRLLFNLLWTGWIIAGTVLEEKDLVTQFGEPYRDYQRKVPMLIPWHRPAAPTPE
jgi:methanethiol S-methyltransferase